VRERSFIAVAVLLAVLIFGAGGVYAYDSARKDRIAEGSRWPVSSWAR
jgi:hypothetical protein